jgi:hypothetical protein
MTTPGKEHAAMTAPGTNPGTTESRRAAARATMRAEVFRLACGSGADLVTRPVFSSQKEPTTRDVEPLAGARAARDLELAAWSTARDYIRQAREAGHGWDQIGHALGMEPGGEPDASAAEAAFTYAAGPPNTEAPWQPRYFGWTCRNCDQTITDCGPVQGPADDEAGHASTCARHAAEIAEWHAQDARWATEWEAGE